MDADSTTLEDFLAACNPWWSLRDRALVMRKLGRIGVLSAADLLRVEQDGLLNDMLTAAGERRFNAETLASIRMAGASPPDDEDNISEEFAQLLSDCAARHTPSPGASQAHARHQHMHDVFLRRQVNRGLAYIDQAAKEVHLRNEHLSQCLQDVQSDISRIADRMQAARRERERGRAATSAAASRLFTDKPTAKAPEPPVQAPASRKYVASQPRTTSAGSKTPAQGSPFAGESPRCARAAQEGFRFGGWPPSSKSSPKANSLPKRHQTLQDSVRAQLASLRHESKADQKAAVKRLLVKWHPDRNLESQATATAIFQLIQQEKDKMLGL